MADTEKKMWGIHTQNDDLFLKKDKIAIGWEEMGDLTVIKPTRDDFKDKYITVYPNAKPGSVATSAGMLYRFCHEAQIGDLVVFPHAGRSRRPLRVLRGGLRGHRSLYSGSIHRREHAGETVSQTGQSQGKRFLYPDCWIQQCFDP